MKTRHVFSTPDITAAEAAIQALRAAGVRNDDISLIARHDIEDEWIADDRQDTSGDFARGGMKGLAAGGGSGLLVGLVAVVVPPLGLTLAGVVAMTLAGAAVGGWVGMLTGASAPDAVRSKFEDEIAQGHVLVIVDGDDHALAAAVAVLHGLDATLLPFATPTAIS